jgi:hypothetical protein
MKNLIKFRDFICLSEEEKALLRSKKKKCRGYIKKDSNERGVQQDLGVDAPVVDSGVIGGDLGASYRFIEFPA